MNRLALRLAVATGIPSFGLALMFEPLLLALLVGAFAGTCSYVACRMLTGRRMVDARRVIEFTRTHRFAEIGIEPERRSDELAELLLEAHRTARSVEKEIQEMRRLEDHRREFIGNVSHELKTPIFAVQGFAETLLDGALEDETVRRSFVEKILRNAARLANMARDLGEISRIETGELRLSLESFSLERLIREVSESLEVQARERDVRLHWAVPPDLPPAFADRESIRQVLLNLVDNAVKYNNPGGRVEVLARQMQGGNLRVTVADNGIGIAPEHVSRVTERFFRVDKSRSRSQGGTGLGLAIVKHLLAAHGQKLVVESIPERGSTFSFTLPVARRLHPPG